MHYFNEIEVQHHIGLLHQEAAKATLANIAKEQQPVVVWPIRQKVGKMLMRMGMRLAGYTL